MYTMLLGGWLFSKDPKDAICLYRAHFKRQMPVRVKKSWMNSSYARCLPILQGGALGVLAFSFQYHLDLDCDLSLIHLFVAL